MDLGNSDGAASGATNGGPLLARPGVQQLLKFCVVGASSTLVDKGILWILLTAFPSVPWWQCQMVSFALGVTNGFFWNSRWTFQARNAGASHRQYSKFMLTNIIGLGLNLFIAKICLVLLTGQLSHGGVNPPKMYVILASLCAIPVVVVWNFCAAKYWTFRPPNNS